MTKSVQSLTFQAPSFNTINHFQKISWSTSSHIFSFLLPTDARDVDLVSKSWQQRKQHFLSQPEKTKQRSISISGDALSMTFSYLFPLELLKVKRVCKLWFKVSELPCVSDEQYQFICGQLQISTANKCMDNLYKHPQYIANRKELDELLEEYQETEDPYPRLEFNFYFHVASAILKSTAAHFNDDSSLQLFYRLFYSHQEDHIDQFIAFSKKLLDHYFL